jgi:hypothetical protein
LAASKALIAFCVCVPSLPSPDSANVIVCLPLDKVGALEAELEPELLHAAERATRPTVSPTAPTRQRVDLLNVLREPI